MNHPIHAMFVHFPAGLIPIAVLFFLLFLYTKRAIFERISITLLGFSSIFLIFAIITGVFDWSTRYLFLLFPIIIIKTFFSLIALLIIVLIWTIRNKYSKNNNISSLSRAYGYILLYLILFPIIAVISYFGGCLVYPSAINNHGDSVRIGSAIYIEKCNACHPYGQGIYDPLIFPGPKNNFGSASILHSELLSDKQLILNYIRNPKRMPAISSDNLSELDFNYVYTYLRYLKEGNSKTELTDSSDLDSSTFDSNCSGCHTNFLVLEKNGSRTIFASSVFNSDTSFYAFLRGNKNRIKNSKMPPFNSDQISDRNIFKLYKYLLTKKK